jgi:hypothetical protein
MTSTRRPTDSRDPIMLQTSTTPAQATHHIDHTELLLLDGAVTRMTESFVTTRTLSPSQRAILEEYGDDVRQLLPNLFGPARDFAEQLAALVRTVLDATTRRTVREKSAKSYAAA